MSLRDRTKYALAHRGRPRAILWAIAPALCFLVPGAGAIVAFAWIVALLVVGQQPVSSLGLSRPPNWLKMIASALVIAAVVGLVSDHIVEPLAQWLARRPLDTSQLKGIAGDGSRLAFFLLLSWLVGALLEETVFRGFMIGYGTFVFGERFKWPLALFSSMAFGFSHLYQGVTGVLLTGAVGFMLAATYIVSKKNLPLVMLVHGFVDTISIVELFVGLQTAQ